MWNYLYLSRELNTPSLGVVLCKTRSFCYRVIVIIVQIIESHVKMVGWRMMLLIYVANPYAFISCNLFLTLLVIPVTHRLPDSKK